MSNYLDDPVISVALWIVIKASLLVGLVAIGQFLMQRRTSAALRHLVWTLAIVGVLLLPILSLVLPEWPIVIRQVTTPPFPHATANGIESPTPSVPQAVSVAEGAESAATDSAAVGSSWFAILTSAYAAGVLLLLIHLSIQRFSVRCLAREATDLQDPQWTQLLSECAATLGVRRPIRLRRSRDRTMPMTFGTRRPTILMPAMADTWAEDRRRGVMLHEVAHVARYDCLTQSLAFAACIMYWFHPAAWWVARRLRTERELACDDRVIAAGARPREYAGHLLEIAYSFGSHRAPALAVSMARPRQLEGRMLAVLDAARNRTVPTLRVRMVGIVIGAALLFPLASGTSSVVAVEPGTDRAPAASVATPELQPDEVRDRVLKPLDTLVKESAGRLVRAAAAAIGVGQDGLPGTWEIRPSNTEGLVHLRLVELNSSSGTNVPIQRLEGLTLAQLTGAGGPVQFRLRRDAGTFTFEGVVRNGVGAGTFSFAPDPNFPGELAKRGFARPTAREQYQLARHDVGYAFLDELNKQGYEKPQTSELVRAGQHGVHVTYLQEMGALGYRLGSLPPLIQLRDHGVTPVYVRELGDLGYKGLSADEIRRARDHGISAEYVRGMRDAGYGSLSMDQLINAKDHGVSAEFVRGLGDAGHRKLPLEQVIRVRDHGVSPEYAREMRQLGHSVPVDDLVRARDHGVSLEFVREMAALGHSSLPLDSLIRLRDHGVSAEYVRELKALGYDRVSVDDLVTLRDHGLTADRIRRANSRAGTRLPVDLLKSFAAGGMR